MEVKHDTVYSIDGDLGIECIIGNSGYDVWLGFRTAILVVDYRGWCRWQSDIGSNEPSCQRQRIRGIDMGSTLQRRYFCKTCQQERLFAKEGPSHLLHLVLTVLTAGGWLVFWLILAIANMLVPFRCQNCGESKVR